MTRPPSSSLPLGTRPLGDFSRKLRRFAASGQFVKRSLPLPVVAHEKCRVRLFADERHRRSGGGRDGGGRERARMVQNSCSSTWRTGWDLNPGQPCGCTAFPVLRLRPDSATCPAQEEFSGGPSGALRLDQNQTSAMPVVEGCGAPTPGAVWLVSASESVAPLRLCARIDPSGALAPPGPQSQGFSSSVQIVLLVTNTGFELTAVESCATFFVARSRRIRCGRPALSYAS